MELWIRSQDKETLLKINNLEIKEFKEGYGIGQWLNESNFYGLGIYKSKERALEVLDEIQNILKPMICLRQGNEEHKLLGARQQGITSTLETEFKELSTYVYEMPME